MDKILTVNDVAELLHVKPITVREMFREKRLRAFKVGKSWRTTEKMLQEDIDALARGESPTTLPMPNGKSESDNTKKAPSTDTAKKTRNSKKNNKTKPKNSDSETPSEEPVYASSQNTSPIEFSETEPENSNDIEEDQPEDEDDLQQFLF